MFYLSNFKIEVSEKISTKKKQQKKQTNLVPEKSR